jgi:RNA polymerase sigma-70 factor, ECF subfamily
VLSPAPIGGPGAGVSVPVEGALDMSRSQLSPMALPAEADLESRTWLSRLRAEGRQRDEAMRELRELLLRAARFEVARRRAALPHLRGGDFDDLAQQSADDALLAILDKLDDFRGESRFTTWAYKFALLEAAVKVRRRAWQGREIPLEPEVWPLIADRGLAPDRDAETSELLAAIGKAIDERLTAHQREILVAITLNDVPIDVLAERLSTTRGALYKTLHDARRKLRAVLSERGLHIGDSEEDAAV